MVNRSWLVRATEWTFFTNIKCSVEVSFVSFINGARLIVSVQVILFYTEWKNGQLTIAIIGCAFEILFVSLVIRPFLLVVSVRVGGIGGTGLFQSSLVDPVVRFIFICLSSSSSGDC